jgi:hypothetical protein
MEQKHLILIGCLIIVAGIILGYLYISKSKESYKVHLGLPVDLPEGQYNILTSDQKPLASNLFTTVQCNDFLFGQTKPSKETSWKLKRVAKGVFILMKPGEKECLYTSVDSSLRSYFFPNCNQPNLCGLPSTNSIGEIDQASLHTYFMILRNPDGKYYIKSMSNDKYICMDGSLKLVEEPTEKCIFDIQSV